MSTAPDDQLPPDSGDDEPVPKLPRGRGLSLDKGMMIRIAGSAALLVMIIVTARPCGEATSKFVNGFGEQGGSATEVLPKPGNVDEPKHYEKLKAGMTDDEVKAAIDRAKASNVGAIPSATGSGDAAAGSNAGSGVNAGSGSAPGSGSAASH